MDTGNHSDAIWVSGYTTSSGVHVSGHWRTRNQPTRSPNAPATATSERASAPTATPGPVARRATPASECPGKVQAGLAELARRREASQSAGRPVLTDSTSTEPAPAAQGEADGQKRCHVCGQYSTAGHTCPGPAADYAGLNRDERLEAMKADLDEAVQTVMESGQLDTWLEAMASNGLTRWSASNRMLAMMQMNARDKSVDGLHLMGFKQWKNYDRSVTKGAQAVWILAPVTKTFTDEDDDGTEIKRRQVVGFKAVPVFDVSDTAGEPMPTSPVAAIDGHATPGTLVGLQDRVTAAGYQYQETTIADCNPETGAGAFGYTDPKNKTIVVDSRLSEADKVSTLSHELGHVHCGHVEAGMDAYRMHRGRMETEAEITSYLVNRSRGMPKHQADARAPAYIAAWSKGDRRTMREAMTTAVAASTTILEGQWPHT